MQVPGTRHMEWGEQTVNERWAWSRSEGTLCDVYIQDIHHSVRGAHVQTIHSSNSRHSRWKQKRCDNHADSRKQEMFRIMLVSSTRIVQVDGGWTWFETNEGLKNMKKKIIKRMSMTTGNLKLILPRIWKYPLTLLKTEWWYNNNHTTSRSVPSPFLAVSTHRRSAPAYIITHSLNAAYCNGGASLASHCKWI